MNIGSLPRTTPAHSSHHRWLFLALATLAALLWSLGSTSEAEAVPAAPGLVTLEQPDGSTFLARQFGDEWYHGVETRTGHTILKQNGWWVYAAKRADGSLRATDHRVGDARPTTRPHLRDTIREARGDADRSRTLRALARENTGLMPIEQVSGEAPVLVILAQFQNQASLGTTAADWVDTYFGPGKSVVDFYRENSFYNLEVVPAAETHGTDNNGVVGWLSLPMDHPDDKRYEDAAIRDAIKAADPWVNYAAYDTDGDGTVQASELHIHVVMAGLEEAKSPDFEPEHSIWAHWSALGSAYTPTVDGKKVGNTGYLTYGEMDRVRGPDLVTHTYQATLGVVVHEMGHDFGLPDLYDGDKSTPGAGLWSVMASGSWGEVATDDWAGETPTMFDAWSRWELGWTGPQTISTGIHRYVSHSATDGAPATTALLLGSNPGGPDWKGDGSGSGSYYLIENRQQTSGTYDEALEGSGMLVLKVDESQPNNSETKLVAIERHSLAGPGALFQLNNPRRSMGDISANGDTMFATLTVAPSSPPANNYFDRPTILSGWKPQVTNQSTAFATAPADEPKQSCSITDTLWYKWTAPGTGTLDVSLRGSDVPGVVNLWRGTTTSNLVPLGCSKDITSVAALKNIPVAAGQTYMVQIGGNPSYTPASWGELDLGLRLRPLNDDRAKAKVLPMGPSTDTTNTINATNENLEDVNSACPKIYNTVWYKVQPTHNSLLRVSTAGSSIDTIVAVWESTSSGLVPVACNNNAPSTTTSLLTDVPLRGGRTYLIQAGAWISGGALTVDTTVRPANDQFSQSATLTGLNGGASSTTTAATKQIGEPNHGGHAAGHSVWWTWTAQHSGPVVFDTKGSTGNTVLGIYTGDSVNALTPVFVNTSASSQTEKEFNAAAGTTYRIAVDNYAESTGAVRLNFHERSDIAVSGTTLDRPNETAFDYRFAVERKLGHGTANISVSVTLPATVAVLAAPAECTASSSTAYTCNVGPLAYAERKTFTLTVRPKTEGPHPASAVYSAGDDNAANDTGLTTASIELVCDNTPTTGNDVVVGTSGHDILCGGAGNDTLRGGLGDDLLLGGAGRDTGDWSAATAPIYVDLRVQASLGLISRPATTVVGDGTDRGTGIENVIATPFNDNLIGTDPVGEVLDGRAGNDAIAGLGAGDTLYGGSGSDRLNGGAGRDTLIGGSGLDTLDGGADADVCQEATDTKTNCEA